MGKVSGIFLDTDELFRAEKLLVCLILHFINRSGLKIYRNDTKDMPSAHLIDNMIVSQKF